MKIDDQLLRRKINDRGYRMTEQRKIVLEELTRRDYHPRAGELYQMVRQRLPRISFATVYRNLKILKKLGLIRELNYGRNFSRYDARIDNHHHFVCIKCGKVYDINPDESMNYNWSKIARKEGFSPIHYRLEFYGYCCSDETER